MYDPNEIANRSLLSSYLRTSLELLDMFISGAKVISDSQLGMINSTLSDGKYPIWIEKFYIPKKNKKLGYRIVYKIWNQFAIDILKVLKFNLNGLYIPEDCVHGFVQRFRTLFAFSPVFGVLTAQATIPLPPGPGAFGFASMSFMGYEIGFAKV